MGKRGEGGNGSGCGTGSKADTRSVCKGDVETVRPPTATATAPRTSTTTTSIAVPIAKLGLDGYHDSPLLLP